MAAYAFDSKSKDEPDLRSESECFPEIDPGLETVSSTVLDRPSKNNLIFLNINTGEQKDYAEKEQQRPRGTRTIWN